MPNECPDCNGKLGVKATKCRCGWSMPGANVVSFPARKIDCCYHGCIEGALCRVWTANGWANVCEKHYPKIEIVRQTSDTWRKLNGYTEAMRQRAKERTPGEDDEPLAALERELYERAQP